MRSIKMDFKYRSGFISLSIQIGLGLMILGLAGCANPFERLQKPQDSSPSNSNRSLRKRVIELERDAGNDSVDIDKQTEFWNELVKTVTERLEASPVLSSNCFIHNTDLDSEEPLIQCQNEPISQNPELSPSSSNWILYQLATALHFYRRQIGDDLAQATLDGRYIEDSSLRMVRLSKVTAPLLRNFDETLKRLNESLQKLQPDGSLEAIENNLIALLYDELLLTRNQMAHSAPRILITESEQDIQIHLYSASTDGTADPEICSYQELSKAFNIWKSQNTATLTSGRDSLYRKVRVKRLQKLFYLISTISTKPCTSAE